MRLLSILCLCVSFWCTSFWAAPVLAQSGRKKKPVFDTEKEAEKREAEGGTESRDPIGDAISRLSGWPSNRSRRAAEMLVVQKERSLERIVGVLVGQTKKETKLKPGAAYVLGRVGDKSNAMTLILVAAEKEQHKFARVFLEAAYELDPERAVDESFRFFHLRATTLRQQTVKFVRAHVKKRNLESIMLLLDPREAKLATTREIGVQLLDRLLQTDQVEWTEVSKQVYRALGDNSPQVARRAMQLCAARPEKENIAALNDLISKDLSYWRERSYASLALAVHSSAYRTQPFTDESLKVLQSDRGLQHPKELLAQGSAALALAQVALRNSDPALLELLDQQIPIVLIEAVGAGNRHYRDFSSVMPLGYTMLRRITGKNLPDEAPVWAQWWRDHGHNFRARRELVDVKIGELSSVIVDVRPPRASSVTPLRVAVVGRVRLSYNFGEAISLETDEMASIMRRLTEINFFKTVEADPKKIGSDEALVVVRVGDLVRTVAMGSRFKGRTEFLASMERLRKDKVWQHFWDRDEYPNWDLFFAEVNRWFFENKDPDARADKLRDLISTSLDDTDLLEDRLRTIRALKKLPGGAKSLSESQMKALLDALAAEPATNQFVVEGVRFLVPDGGKEASLTIVGLLSSHSGPDALGLLRHVCKNLPPEEVIVLSEDKRFLVRVAATRALEDLDPEISNDPLRARLTDTVVLVRVAAAEALARRKDKEALPILAALAQDSTKPDVRAAAAYAYGLIGGPDGLRGIEPLLFDDAEPDVRRRAIEGLRAGKTEGAAELMLRVFEDETDRTVRAAAAFAVVDLETPELVESLIQRLEVTESGSNTRVALVNVLARFTSKRTVPVLQRVLRGDDVNARDAAALGLARRWDPVAVSQLIRMARSKRHARAAVQHLEVVTSQAFESEDYEEISRNYSDWFKIHSTGDPALWFRDALLLRGYETSVLNPFIEGSKKSAAGETPVESVPLMLRVIPVEAVPLMLRVLRDDDWYLSRNASMLLARKIGPDAPTVLEYFLSAEERESAIREYNAWWHTEEARLEKERRG